MRSAITLFFVLAGVWLLNSGHYTPMLIGFGFASCLFVLALSWRMKIVDEECVPIHLVPRIILYIPWLLLEVFKANVDVARRILTPGRRSLSPRVFDAAATQRTDLGRVLFANSITLTPGTVSIEVRCRAVTVHAIAEEVADGLLDGEMDRRVSQLEGGKS